MVFLGIIVTLAGWLISVSSLTLAAGNRGRLAIVLAGILVSLVGIEKVVPRAVDLAVMLKLLARSATGQPITIYTNVFGGPRAPGEKDGPEELLKASSLVWVLSRPGVETRRRATSGGYPIAILFTRVAKSKARMFICFANGSPATRKSFTRRRNWSS